MDIEQFQSFFDASGQALAEHEGVSVVYTTAVPDRILCAACVTDHRSEIERSLHAHASGEAAVAAQDPWYLLSPVGNFDKPALVCTECGKRLNKGNWNS
jgi:hypothetical protein